MPICNECEEEVDWVDEQGVCLECGNEIFNQGELREMEFQEELESWEEPWEDIP